MEFDFATLAKDFWQWVLITFLGAILWLFKSVNAQGSQIKQIVQDMKHRERLREEDRAVISDLRRDVQVLRDSSQETRESLRRIEGMLSSRDRDR